MLKLCTTPHGPLTTQPSHPHSFCIIIIAAVNMIFTVAAIIIFIHYLRQYNKGLKDYCELYFL